MVTHVRFTYQFAESSPAAPDARHSRLRQRRGCSGNSQVAQNENTQISPRLQDACHLAQDALMLAIQSVDNVLDDNDCALDHPELVVAFMTFAASAYRAAEETPTIN